MERSGLRPTCSFGSELRSSKSRVALLSHGIDTRCARAFFISPCERKGNSQKLNKQKAQQIHAGLFVYLVLSNGTAPDSG